MSQVRHRIEGAVGWIELHNPPHQFMTAQMVRELDVLTERWESDPGVRAIVITGTHPQAFITHYSVEEQLEHPITAPTTPTSFGTVLAVKGMMRWVDSAHRVLGRLPLLRKSVESMPMNASFQALLSMGQIHRVFARLERMDKAVIAAINGSAMGGGCELALACDYRLMARGDFAIGLVEVLGGIVPGAGGTQRLAAAVGQAKAIELMLDGTVMNADEAARIGLVTRAVEPKVLRREAAALAERLATRAPAAVGQAKRSVRIGTRLPIDDGLAFEKLASALCSLSNDATTAAEYYLARFRAGCDARQIFDELRQRGTG